jgi:glycosyltransferase involved in cell wall biosynthesis
MKILLTVHQFFPRCYHGTERYTLDLAHALQTLGHQVLVLTTFNHIDECAGTPWREYEHEGVPVVAIDLLYAGRAGFTTSYSRPDLTGIYGEIICREKPDIIHCCHLLHLGAEFLAVASLARVPIVMTLTDFFGICWTNRLQTCQARDCAGPDHDDFNCVQDVLRTVKKPFGLPGLDFMFRQLLGLRPFAQLVRRLLKKERLSSPALQSAFRGIEARRPCLSNHYRHIDHFIAPTSYLREAYLRSGYTSDKIERIGFGITQPTEAEKLSRRHSYESLIKTDRPLVIGFIGQIAKHKGVLDLLSAYSSAQLENCELHLYGGLNQSPKVTAVVQRYASTDSSIKLCGTFAGQQIYQKLSAIDVLVLPSTWAENSPLVLLNALASKTLVVVSDVKGMVELVSDGVNGHLCPPNAPAELRLILSNLARRRHELPECFDRNTAAYLTSPLDYARQIETRYRRLLSARTTNGHYIRESFPPLIVPPVTLTIIEQPRPVKTGEHEDPFLANWTALECSSLDVAPGESDALILHPKNAAAAVILYRAQHKQRLRQLTFSVWWPHDCETAFFYTTKAEPGFSEARKISRPVKGGLWQRVVLTFTETDGEPTQVRWDPDRTPAAAGSAIRVAALTPVFSI